MGIGDWIEDRIPDVSPDLPAWFAERGSNVASVTNPVTSRLGTAADVAKTGLNYAFNPKYDPGLALPIQWGKGIYGRMRGEGGAPAAAAPATDQNAPPAAGDQGFQYLINPLAANMFYAQTIGPLLQQMSERYGQQTQQFQGAAANAAQQFPMPAQFQSFFARERPQMAQNQLNLQTALQAAALQQPQYDTMMQRLGDIQNTSMNLYQQQLANKALASAGLGGLDPAELASALKD